VVLRRKISITIQSDSRRNRRRTGKQPAAAFSTGRENSMICPPRLLRCLLNDESGQDLIEYALIAALIAVAAIAAIKGLTTKITTEFNTIGSSL
jgi:pilus assembly protein Flp/PilA